MSPFNEGITLDANVKAHPFLRRRLADSAMMHLVDGLMLLLALLAGDGLLFLWHGVPVQLAPILFLIPAWWIGTWMTRLVPGWGLGAVEELRRIELLLVTLFAGVTVVLFLGNGMGGPSRITLLASFLVAMVLVPLGRVIAKSILCSLNLWGVPAVIYGDAESVPVVVAALTHDRGLGYNPRGVLADDLRQGQVIAGLPILGRLSNSTRKMPVAVVALPDLPREQMLNLLEGPLQGYRTILLIPDLINAPSLWVKPCDLQGILGLEIQHTLLDPVANFTKSLIDRLVVLLTLPFWGPVSLLVMLLVWLQDFHAPVYAQERIGRNNKVFKAYKLRTMVPDAEGVLRKKLAQDPALKAEWEQNYKLKKDPRITLIGNLLRKTSLDELPQLWCVLIGTMALVGPRPLPKYHHDELKERTQRLRVKVRPGITGLWQVSGRSASGTAGMDRWDSYYVSNWSIWLDVVILVRTVRVVLLGSGAY